MNKEMIEQEFDNWRNSQDSDAREDLCFHSAWEGWKACIAAMVDVTQEGAKASCVSNPQIRISVIPTAKIKEIADYIWRKIQPGESGISRSMIADIIVEAMEDAATRKDADLRVTPHVETSSASHYSDCNTNGYDTPAGIKYAPESECDCGLRSEISVIGVDDLRHDLFYDALFREAIDNNNIAPTESQYHRVAERAAEFFRPYLRTTKPVSYTAFDAMSGEGKVAYRKGYDRGLADAKPEPVTIDLVKAIWNAGADIMNQWENLGGDEKNAMCRAAGAKYVD